MPTIKIILIEDEEAVRETLKEYFKKNAPNNIEVIGEFVALEELPEIFEPIPDFIICDINLSDNTDIDYCLKLAKQYPKSKILILSAYVKPNAYEITQQLTNELNYSTKILDKNFGNANLDIMLKYILDEVLIKIGDVFISLCDTVLIATENSILYAFDSSGRQQPLNETMENIINCLPKYFIRTHRSYIINLKFVKELQENANNHVYSLGLKNKTERIPLSEARFKEHEIQIRFYIQENNPKSDL
jgi:DNA-binding LytR/AlgR family response regulator